MEKHITAVAALHVGFSILRVFIAIIVFIILTTTALISRDPDAYLVLSTVGIVVGVFILVISIPGIIGGIALFSHKNWGRILILIISALELLSIPIGTALGVYSIWVLVQDETVKLFQKK
ncbi:MAG: hypothetical protein JXB60_01770 [Candidatus Cloacimonetes bacterium]|nr:hypothetical protein [Candidatus Cloacimonadota bacterium]